MALEDYYPLRRYLNEGLFDYQDDLEREGMEPDSAFPPVRIVSHLDRRPPTTADTCWKCNQPGTPLKPLKRTLHGTFQHDLSCNPEVHA